MGRRHPRRPRLRPTARRRPRRHRRPRARRRAPRPHRRRASGPDSNADSKPPDSSPPASDASPPSSQAPDSKPPDSDGCAEIPTAAHAVLTAAIKLGVRVPLSKDKASQLPDTLTLTNDDSSYNKTLRFASDCQDGDTDGTSLLLFEDLTDGHTYSLQGNDGRTDYSIFKDVPYAQVLNLGGADTSSSSSASSDPSANAGSAPDDASGASGTSPPPQ
jgi:hypothetical protein